MSEIRSFIEAYQNNPLAFVEDCLKKQPDNWQKEFLNSLATPENPNGERKLSLRSGHGVGKSTIVCWGLIWHLLFKFPQKSIVTAPSQNQLFSALWPDLKSYIDALPAVLLDMVEYTAETVRLREAPNESFIHAKVSRLDNFDALQGVHSEHVMLCVDEAAGVHEKVYQAAYGSMSSESARMVLCGNPTKPTGYFFDTFHALKGEWKNFHISCLESSRVSPSYINEQEIQWGRESNEFRIRVEGNFPLADSDCFIPFDIVSDAVHRDVIPNPDSPVIWALDVARMGNDLSALCKRRSNTVLEPIKTWRKLDLMELCGAVLHEWDETKTEDRPSELCIDAIGLGSGVFDRLAEDGRIPVRGINVSTKPLDAQYLNLRAELWGKAKEWCESKVTKLTDPKLAAELSQPKYSYTSTMKMQIESKESMRGRGLKSVDLADSFCLSFASTPLFGIGGSTRWNEPLKREIGGVV